MALPKKKFRELVFQLLFCGAFSSIDEEVTVLMMRQFFVSKKGVREALDHARKVMEKQHEFDSLIGKNSFDFSIDRISKIELTILRLALFEMFYEENVCEKVAISEAIRLARKFATRESAGYVNAILDAIYKQQPQAAGC
jgi:N utilization substance protein B